MCQVAAYHGPGPGGRGAVTPRPSPWPVVSPRGRSARHFWYAGPHMKPRPAGGPLRALPGGPSAVSGLAPGPPVGRSPWRRPLRVARAPSLRPSLRGRSAYRLSPPPVAAAGAAPRGAPLRRRLVRPVAAAARPGLGQRVGGRGPRSAPPAGPPAWVGGPCRSSPVSRAPSAPPRGPPAPALSGGPAGAMGRRRSSLPGARRGGQRPPRNQRAPPGVGVKSVLSDNTRPLPPGQGLHERLRRP